MKKISKNIFKFLTNIFIILLYIYTPVYFYLTNQKFSAETSVCSEIPITSKHSMNSESPKETNTIKKTDNLINSENKTLQITVYITKCGKKYHKSGCKYLKYSSKELDINDAQNMGYFPCLNCCY